MKGTSLIYRERKSSSNDQGRLLTFPLAPYFESSGTHRIQIYKSFVVENYSNVTTWISVAISITEQWMISKNKAL